MSCDVDNKRPYLHRRLSGGCERKTRSLPPNAIGEGVERAVTIFGCEPYLVEDRYRDALNRGRIRFAERRPVIAEELAQARPALGHPTNAICHVGRRERTRGLYFDRRNVLTSYDPTPDNSNGTILARTMAAVFPCAGGINLEYYFSHVDPPGYGYSTKTAA